MDKLKSKMVLTGVAAIAALSFGVSAHAATDTRPVYDLSEWQGNITAAQAKALKAEVQGVILRVQYGSNYRDKTFEHNSKVLTAAGVKYGVYSYSRYINVADAKVEANDLYKRAPKASFYVNDAEENTITSGSYAAAAKAWGKPMQKLTSKKVAIYSYRWFYSGHINSKKNYDDLWLAAYQSSMPVPKDYNWWQNSSTHYSIALGKSVDASKIISDNPFKTATSKFTIGGFSSGDKVKIKAGAKFYDTKQAVDSSLTKVNLTVDQTKPIYTGKSKQVLIVKNGSKIIGQVRAQDVTEIKRMATKPAKSAKWIKESKTYTLKTAVNLRAGASTSSKLIAPLPSGTTVKTDRAIIKGGYRWVRQPRVHGYGYLVTGPASNSLAYVKSGASHTHYTVKCGDSWWVIAQRNGLSMYKLASQNGKSIYSAIYPGEKLIIK